jgi:mycofactocin precursor
LALSVETCYQYGLQLASGKESKTMADKAVRGIPSSEAEEPPERAEPEAAEDELVLDEMLVEDVSIDGMCGVY